METRAGAELGTLAAGMEFFIFYFYNIESGSGVPSSNLHPDDLSWGSKAKKIFLRDTTICSEGTRGGRLAGVPVLIQDPGK